MPASKRTGIWSTCLITAVLVGQALPAQAHDPRLRADLIDSLGPIICEGEHEAKPSRLWKRGVFDSQIDSQLLAVKNASVSPRALLAKRARSMATLRHAGGYSYGLCTDGTRGWIASLRAPAPVNIGPKGPWLQLPESLLNNECSGYQIDFASADDAHVRSIASGVTKLNMTDLGRGVISISCQTKTPKWRGPVLWYLVPASLPEDSQAPFSDTFSTGPKTDVSASKLLLAWINKVRQNQNLSQLQIHAALNEAAYRLAVDRSVDHNRTALSGSSNLLAKQGVKLLAEDRVRAENLATMTWLLWFSPRHRASLLRPDATFIGIDISTDQGQSLGILLLGNQMNQST
ncbi:MAG: CAP domain-containing protein [Deltaproteobacteria bacterium]|nr:CAP domain-containing protein [Deltaproteobacteria bacterium]